MDAVALQDTVTEAVRLMVATAEAERKLVEYEDRINRLGRKWDRSDRRVIAQELAEIDELRQATNDLVSSLDPDNQSTVRDLVRIQLAALPDGWRYSKLGEEAVALVDQMVRDTSRVQRFYIRGVGEAVAVATVVAACRSRFGIEPICVTLNGESSLIEELRAHVPEAAAEGRVVILRHLRRLPPGNQMVLRPLYDHLRTGSTFPVPNVHIAGLHDVAEVQIAKGFAMVVVDDLDEDGEIEIGVGNRLLGHGVSVDSSRAEDTSLIPLLPPE